MRIAVVVCLLVGVPMRDCATAQDAAASPALPEILVDLAPVPSGAPISEPENSASAIGRVWNEAPEVDEAFASLERADAESQQPPTMAGGAAAVATSDREVAQQDGAAVPPSDDDDLVQEAMAAAPGGRDCDCEPSSAEAARDCDNEDTCDVAQRTALYPAPAEAVQETAAAPGEAAPALASSIDRLIDLQTKILGSRTPILTRTIGQRVGRNTIIIHTSERRLLYFFNDYMAMEFPIGIARRNLQRLGTTRITLKRRNPTWVPTGLQHRVYRNLPAAVGPGPKNPLGTRALNLTIPNIRIHGTNDDSYVGEAGRTGASACTIKTSNFCSTS